MSQLTANGKGKEEESSAAVGADRSRLANPLLRKLSSYLC